MITHLRPTILLILAFWILWSKLRTGNLDSSWDYQDSFDTRKDCENSAASWIETVSKNPFWKELLGKSKNRLRFISEDGHETTLEYICVPDTVDPRPRR